MLGRLNFSKGCFESFHTNIALRLMEYVAFKANCQLQAAFPFDMFLFKECCNVHRPLH